MNGKKGIGEAWGEVAINSFRGEPVEEICKYASEFEKLVKKCADERRGGR